MKATIEIQMDNAAFEGADCGYELARCLKKLAGKVEGASARQLADQAFKVMDGNGNGVGQMVILED